MAQQRLPWRQLSPSLYQLGWGQHSRFVDSTHTDATPVVSSNLAKNKRDAKRFLSPLGFPVVPGELVSSLEAAKAVAKQLGYPVVIKPASQDGGESVFIGLADEEELSNAFQQIHPKYHPLLVERHVGGADYRLTVWHGNVEAVLERRPARVCGDGTSTIEQLIDQTNNLRRHRNWEAVHIEQYQSPFPIYVDSDTERWLRHQGLNLQSVPAANAVVRLRGAASMSQGGERRSVPFAEVHPDNALLALDVAEAFRLDFAGIVLLIPDISRSWRDVSAYICEVNSQPQLLRGFDRMVAALLVGDGRIPVTVIVTDDMPENEQHSLAQTAAARLRGTAFITDHASFVDGRLTEHPLNKKRALANRVLLNRGVKQLVWVMTSHQIKASLPFDYASLLIIDDENLSLSCSDALAGLAWLQDTKSGVVMLSELHLSERPNWQVIARLLAETIAHSTLNDVRTGKRPRRMARL